MIPFGGSFKIGYAPDLDTYGSGNNAGPTQVEGTAAYVGRSATQYASIIRCNSILRWC